MYQVPEFWQGALCVRLEERVAFRPLLCPLALTGLNDAVLCRSGAHMLDSRGMQSRGLSQTGSPGICIILNKLPSDCYEPYISDQLPK